MLSPAMAGWLADLMLVVHVGIVLFVVLGQLTILLGGWRGWAWIRHFGLRATHLALIAIVVLQAWLGRVCPLTIWEQALRRQAGQTSYGDSFVEHWLSRLIFFEAPWWVFVAAYSAFAAVVVLSWIWLPPRRNAALR
jgi:hypothetical protein